MSEYTYPAALPVTTTGGWARPGWWDVVADGEKAVSSTNRNYIGRMGHKGSEVYLAGPAVVAASAVTGYICTPDDMEAGK